MTKATSFFRAWMTRASACAALIMPTVAQASTLIVYDTSEAYGQRMAASPYAQQDFERAATSGLVRRIRIPVDDAGNRSSYTIEVVRPVQPPVLGVGVRVQSRSVTWRATTERRGERLGYEVVVTEVQGFVNGITPPTQVAGGDVVLQGVGDVAAQPTFARSYPAPAGRRIMVGFVIP